MIEYYSTLRSCLQFRTCLIIKIILFNSNTSSVFCVLKVNNKLSKVIFRISEITYNYNNKYIIQCMFSKLINK